MSKSNLKSIVESRFEHYQVSDLEERLMLNIRQSIFDDEDDFVEVSSELYKEKCFSVEEMIFLSLCPAERQRLVLKGLKIRGRTFKSFYRKFFRSSAPGLDFLYGDWYSIIETQLGGPKKKAVRKLFVDLLVNEEKDENQDKLFWVGLLWKHSTPEQLQKLLRLEQVAEPPSWSGRRNTLLDLTNLIQFVGGIDKFVNLVSKNKVKTRRGDRAVIGIYTYDSLKILNRSLKEWPEKLQEMKRPRFRNLWDVHEFLWKQQLENEPNYELEVNPTASKLDGKVVGEFTLVLPKSTRTLKEWGKELNHCVGGYGPAINRGESVIISLYENGVAIYTIELVKNSSMIMGSNRSRWVVNQFYGEGNSNPPKEVVETISIIVLEAMN
jgi:hypothetical protein